MVTCGRGRLVPSSRKLYQESAQNFRFTVRDSVWPLLRTTTAVACSSSLGASMAHMAAEGGQQHEAASEPAGAEIVDPTDGTETGFFHTACSSAVAGGKRNQQTTREDFDLLRLTEMPGSLLRPMAHARPGSLGARPGWGCVGGALRRERARPGDACGRLHPVLRGPDGAQPICSPCLKKVVGFAAQRRPGRLHRGLGSTWGKQRSGTPVG